MTKLLRIIYCVVLGLVTTYFVSGSNFGGFVYLILLPVLNPFMVSIFVKKNFIVHSFIPIAIYVISFGFISFRKFAGADERVLGGSIMLLFLVPIALTILSTYATNVMIVKNIGETNQNTSEIDS